MLVLRLARGLSQRDLASLLGTKRTYITKLERHGRSVTLGTLERIAAALQVPPRTIIRIATGERFQD